jgi:hypothetical protein
MVIHGVHTGDAQTVDQNTRSEGEGNNDKNKINHSLYVNDRALRTPIEDTHVRWLASSQRCDEMMESMQKDPKRRPEINADAIGGSEYTCSAGGGGGGEGPVVHLLEYGGG